MSGYVHVHTDLFTVHDYEQDPEEFRKHYASVDPVHPENAYVCKPEHSAPYKGQPYIVDEYGGTYWLYDKKSRWEKGWGYGYTPKNL